MHSSSAVFRNPERQRHSKDPIVLRQYDVKLLHSSLVVAHSSTSARSQVSDESQLIYSSFKSGRKAVFETERRDFLLSQSKYSKTNSEVWKYRTYGKVRSQRVHSNVINMSLLLPDSPMIWKLSATEIICFDFLISSATEGLKMQSLHSHVHKKIWGAHGGLQSY